MQLAPKTHQLFARFYLHLELNLMHSHPNGEWVLIAYQAKVWCQWHDDIARGQGFNITQINQRLLATVAKEVWDMICLEAVRKFSEPLTFSGLFTNEFSSHAITFSPLSQTCHCHCHAAICKPLHHLMIPSRRHKLLHTRQPCKPCQPPCQCHAILSTMPYQYMHNPNCYMPFPSPCPANLPSMPTVNQHVT